MIDVASLQDLQREVHRCIQAERGTLVDLREDVRGLRGKSRRIRAHSTTAISIVATDGGNNQIRFDPFMVQVIRVVDSNNNEYCLEALTPRTALSSIVRRHLLPTGESTSAFGRMMVDLGAESLTDLSLLSASKGDPNPSWVQVYRELMEWAVLLDLVRRRDFASDTVIIFDGFLRSKVFAGELFRRFRKKLESAIAEQYKKNRRRIFVAGIAKHSKVLETYRLAMALENTLRTAYPSYVEIPRALEQKVYKWSEYARGSEEEEQGGEVNKFVAGKMFFVKFGNSPYDPMWAIDILESQADQAQTILGYLLADAIDGFPIPYYPMSLQKAHENAALVDFDFEILQDEVANGIRALLGSEKSVIDELSLQALDIAERRYG